jgi:hypothetical protein
LQLDEAQPAPVDAPVAAPSKRVPLRRVLVDLDGAEPVPSDSPRSASIALQQQRELLEEAESARALNATVAATGTAAFHPPVRAVRPTTLLRPLHPVSRFALGAESLSQPSSKALHQRSGKGYRARVRYS